MISELIAFNILPVGIAVINARDTLYQNTSLRMALMMRRQTTYADGVCPTIDDLGSIGKVLLLEGNGVVTGAGIAVAVDAIP
jgi:hypothetical protein